MFYRSVDDVVRGFTRMTKRLEAVAQRHVDNANASESRANELIKQAHASRSEHARATRLAGRIQELLS